MGHLTQELLPALAFLPGYASDMGGTKALALDAWARETSRVLVRFDYRGCGARGGRFEDFTLHDWLADALEAIDATAGPLILIGSSMGGWLMLLAALARPHRVAALVGIAAAPDFTQWGFSEDQKATLARDGRIEAPSPYGPPLVTTHAFWESGQALRLPPHIAIDCAVRLLHGQTDADVPWSVPVDLASRLRSRDVQVTLIKDGDHRLSRSADIDLLIATITALDLP